MSEEKLKVVFAPGCFDHFDGTQEELDQLMKEIQDMVSSGEIFEKSTPVDLDSLTDEAIEQMANVLFSADERKLH
jgi:transcription antitermination factor NusG